LCSVISASSDNLYGLCCGDETPLSMLISFNRVHGGGYTTLFFMKLFSSYFSKLFNIHYADFIGSYMGIIKGFFFSIFIFTFINCSFIYKKSYNLFISLFIFLSLWSYVVIYKNPGAEWLIYNNSNFFRYIIPLIFYFIIFSLLHKSILSRIHIHISRYFILAILLSCIFVSTNLETIAITSVLSFVFLILYNIAAKIFIKKFEVLSKYNFIFNFDKAFYITFSFLAIIFCLYIFSPGTHSLIESRVDLNFTFTEFLHNWFQTCFINNFIYNLLILISLIIAAFYAVKRKEINKIVYFFIIYISTFTTMLFLAFANKEECFYIFDYRIQYTYKIMLLYVLFCLISYILKRIKYSNIYISFMSVFLIIFSILLFAYIKQNYSEFSVKPHMYYLEKKKNYIQEKIFRYYNLINKTPYLDSTNIINNSEKFIIWSPSTGLECEALTNPIIFYYYIQVYNEEPYNEICFSDNAIEMFYQNGGYFTKEEIENVKFNSLLDNNFVLRAKGEKFSSSQIAELMKTPINK
jgi:hypothetical protein